MADRRRTRTGSGTPWLGITLAAILGLGLGGASGVTAGYLMRPDAGAASALEGVADESGSSQGAGGPIPFMSWDQLQTDMTLLLMGVDATGGKGRDGLQANSDTMLLLRLSPSDGKIWALSLPRDTRVRIPGHGTFKINAAESWGGPELAATTVSNFLDVPIHRYLVVSLQGVTKAIDAIGGVDVTIAKAMDYDDWAGRLHIHLKPGLQHLTGEQVEAFLRFRKDDIGSDVARVQRQQGFLMEAAKQFLKPAVILRIIELWGIIQDHAQTNLTPAELLQIARWARNLDVKQDMTMTVLPGDYQTIKGGSYWVPDVDAVEPYLDAHFRDRSGGNFVAERQGRPKVVIWDATGRRPKLKPLERRLREAGYVVWALDRRKRRALTTRVIVQRGDVDGAKQLAGTVGVGEVFPAAVGDLNSDFTLELGEDWQGDLAANQDSEDTVAGARSEHGQP